MFKVKNGSAKLALVGLVSLGFVFTCFGMALAEDIVARGSDSTITVVQALAKAFQEKTGISIKVEGGGSSKGVKDCLAGEVDLAFMSRAPKGEETQGGLVGYPYAIDGVAIIVNPANPATDIKLELLKDIYTGKTNKWSDGKPIMALNRPETSGTREVFHEKVMGKDATYDPKIMIKHDAASHSTVAQAVTAIAYTSSGALSGAEKLNVLTVEGVKSTPTTLRDGSYPISRKLHLATKGPATGKVKEFIDFVTSETGQKVAKGEHMVPLRDV